MGKKFGEWERDERLGEGGQSRVYICHKIDDPHGKKYALKLLKNEDKIGRLSMEIKARQDNAMKFVPKIYDYDLQSEKPYIVEEYIIGGTLNDNIGTIKGDIKRALGYFIQICQIVIDAHNKNIIHRDIKPENILYNKDEDKFYLTDFGICYIQNEERFTITDERVGPRDYICPELERGRVEQPTKLCDIYSLGKLLYFILTGKIVYREDYRKESYNLIRVLGDNQLERINRIFDESIRVNPEDRYDSVNKMVREVMIAKKLIFAERGIVSYGLGTKCLFCGIGMYRLIAHYDTNRHNSNEFGDKTILFNDWGLNIGSHQTEKCHILQCNHCGNLQYFVRDKTNNEWEEPNDIILSD